MNHLCKREINHCHASVFGMLDTDDRMCGVWCLVVCLCGVVWDVVLGCWMLLDLPISVLAPQYSLGLPRGTSTSRFTTLRLAQKFRLLGFFCGLSHEYFVG